MQAVVDDILFLERENLDILNMKNTFEKTFSINDKEAIAKYYVSGSEPFVQGHYPQDAIFPGVMSLNLMKTLSEQYAKNLSFKYCERVFLKRISYVGDIRPGDVLDIVSITKKSNQDELYVSSSISVDGDVKSKSLFVFGAVDK